MGTPKHLSLIFFVYCTHSLLGQKTYLIFNDRTEVLISTDYSVYNNTNGHLKYLDYQNLPVSYTASKSIYIEPGFHLGHIESDQVICQSITPTTLKLVDTSEINGIKYTWQYASESASTTFIDINEHTKELNFSNLSDDEYPSGITYYRVQVSIGEPTYLVTHTQAISITTQLPVLNLKHNGQGTAFCEGDTLEFTATVSETGIFTFYINDIAVKQTKTSSTQASFTLQNSEDDINLTVHFKSSTGCFSESSLSLQSIKVSPGKISRPENICSNTKNIILESTQNANVNGEPLSGNGFSYQWQSSLDGNSFADILNATTEEYTISLLTTDTHFRRIVKTTVMGAECIKSSNVIKLSLNDLSSQPSSIQVSTSLCSEGVYASYTGGVPPYKGELFDINHNLIGSGATNDNQSFENLVSGRFYTLRVTDNSCYQPKEIVFEVPLKIKFDPQKVTIEHDLCREQSTDIGQGSIRLAADAFTGGSNAFDFSWSGPNFTGQGSEINGLLPGTYLLTATDKLLGCTQTESIVVLGKDPLALSLKPSNLSLRSDGVYQLGCQSGSNPSIEVNVSGGHGQYTYSWKKDGILLSGNQTKLITPVTAGVYQVTVTDIPPTGIEVDNPCQEIVYFNVQSDIPIAIQVDRTALGVTLCENNNIQIPVKISGGIPPYTLTIEGHGSISTEQNSYTFSNIDPKKLGSNLNVNVTDQVGCSASAPSIPIESPNQYTFISSNTNIDCLKGTLGAIQLSLDQPLSEIETFDLEWKGDTVHYFDTWENGNGLLKNLNNPGTYTVTVTNSQGCIVHTESFKIEDLSKSKLAVKITEQIANSHCDSANGAIKLEINGGYPPYSIDWQQLSQTNSWTTLPVFENHALISGLSSGTFRAIVGDASSEHNVDRCSEKITTREIIIQQKSVKIVQFTASNAADLCNSNGSGKISFQIQNTLTSTGTTSLIYQIDGANVSANDINNQGNQIEIKGISPGSHQLKVQIKSESSNCIISHDFSIENPLAPITFTGQRTYESSLCNEATKIIIKTEEISGGSPFELEPPYALEWHYQPLNENTDTVSHTRYGWEINNALPGSYELIISDAYGCQNDPSVPIIIKVEPPQIEAISVKGILKSNSDEIVKALPVQCENEDKGTIGIKIEGGVRPLEIRWFFLQPQGVVNDSSTDDPTHLPIHDNQTFLNGLSPGVYRLEINGETAMCENGTSPYIFYTEDIEVKPNPSLHLVSGPFIEGNLCEGKPGRITVEVFDNNQDGLYFYYDGKVIQEEEYEQINNQTHTLIIENPVEEGELEIFNTQGCSIKHSINLKLGDPDFSFTSASYEITKNILAKEEITFRNNSTNPYVKSEWIFGDFSQPVVLSHTASSSIVKHTFLKSGVYPVTLRIYNTNGCSQEVKHMVSVGKGYSISLPNVFSPNNDGINDQFRPIISGFKEVEFNVFDPRGNLLYHEKMEEPNPNHAEGLELKGWDANNATQALYFIYSLSGVLFDETEIDKSGTFILLK